LSAGEVIVTPGDFGQHELRFAEFCWRDGIPDTIGHCAHIDVFVTQHWPHLQFVVVDR